MIDPLRQIVSNVTLYETYMGMWRSQLKSATIRSDLWIKSTQMLDLLY